MHITETVQMHHRRNRRNDHEHHDRYRIEHDTQVDVQPIGKPQPLEIIGRYRRINAIDTRLQEILSSDDI
ncbi:unknown [Bacteroides sp. CAG:144]|nr:unknown [Bacteroides sp. CAG:144]